MDMLRRNILQLLGLGIVPGLRLTTAHANQHTRPPNIVLIVADDLGYEVPRFNGGETYDTPKLQYIADRGMRFSHCYATPLCTTTRVQLLTGQYPFRSGWTNTIWGAPREKQIVNPRMPNIAHILKNAGYRTAVAGKWQLARFDDHPDHAMEFGFDEHCLWVWRYKDSKGTSRYWKPHIWQNGKLQEDLISEDIFGPDVFSSYLVDFIKRNRERPFFAYYPMTLPHKPFVSTPDDRDSGREPSGYAGLVSYLDKLVGKIQDAIEDLGLSENTILVFTSDNGSPKDVVSQWKGMRIVGDKNEIKDRGVHVPLVVRWDSVIPANSESRELVDISDIFPTLVEVAGARVPEQHIVDGKSFLPQLQGETTSRRDWVLIQLKEKMALRTHRWKLVNDGYLYDMETDPFENSPISEADDTPESMAARSSLQVVMESLDLPKTLKKWGG